MAPAYKLTYFPVQALAEPIRFLFSYGGIEFEDCRFEREQWPQIKPDMPFGQVPVLEHNGKKIGQSIAIARYIAKQVKLVGKDDWENLEIDAMVDTVNDLRLRIALYHYETDQKIKESRKESLFKETIPYFMERLERIAEKNGGHLAVGRLTWADFYFAGLLNYLNFMTGMDLVENYPNLKGMVEKILEIPSIKQWIEKRPKTDM